MSFGFSASDFVSLARAVWKIYQALKTGPEEYQAFSREILLFHNILDKFDEIVLRQCLEPSELAVVRDFHSGCQKILFDMVDAVIDATDRPDLLNERREFFLSSGYAQLSDRSSFSYRFRTAKFVRKIPKLQRAVSAQIEKLTSYNVLLVQSNQKSIQDSQNRTEASQTSIESSQQRMIESQARIEERLERILAKEEKREDSVISHVLNASSPEGRQTWMRLGRLLRKEGITPSHIENNRDVLIRAMKKTLSNSISRAESLPESYRTAREYPENSLSLDDENDCSFGLPIDPCSFPSIKEYDSSCILGSAPPKSASFSEVRRRYIDSASNFAQDQNIEIGMGSLREGMCADPIRVDNDGITDREERSDFEGEKLIREMDQKNFPRDLLLGNRFMLAEEKFWEDIPNFCDKEPRQHESLAAQV